MGEKTTGEQTLCECAVACEQTQWNAINIWRAQAKTLGNSHWAVVPSPGADLGLLFKSADKECWFALYMEMKFSVELGEYNQYS